MNKKVAIPFGITLAGVVLMIIMLFLPYASATSEYKEVLNQNKEGIFAQEIGMTNADAVHISLVKYARIYAAGAKSLEAVKAVAIMGIIIISAYALFAVLTLLMTILKKSIAIIVFDILALLDFWLIRFDFSDRGVIPSSRYDWGIASYLPYFLGVVVLAGAIWMLVEKRKMKEQ